MRSLWDEKSIVVVVMIVTGMPVGLGTRLDVVMASLVVFLLRLDIFLIAFFHLFMMLLGMMPGMVPVMMMRRPIEKWWRRSRFIATGVEVHSGTFGSDPESNILAKKPKGAETQSYQ